MTYFTIMLRVSIMNDREWYVEEYPYGNTLHKIHARFKLVFETKDEVIELIHKKIESEGGSYLAVIPHQGKHPRKTIRRKTTKGRVTW